MSRTIPPALIRQQRRAADPANSAWVMANAGSGKTFVLVRRVLRLLLDGVDPGRLLCLTFTTAAAAQMADRIAQELAIWARADAETLAASLADLLGREASSNETTRARQLFAMAVETPGRLKIQTIHAFCERVLQLFPFEAAVPAGFAVLDGPRANALIDQALAQVLVEAHHDTAGTLSQALDTILNHRGESQMRDALAQLIGQRSRYMRWRQAGGTAFKSLDLDPADRTEDVLDDFAQCSAIMALGMPTVIDALLGDRGDKMKAVGATLAAIEPADRLAQAHGLIDAYLRKSDGKPKTHFPAKTLRESAPNVAAAFEADRDLALATLDKLRAIDVALASEALFHLTDRVLATYAALKAATSALDFDDLIARMSRLLDSGHGAWVLYRLDRGIDHILVDEAQDTSPEQWRIIRAIAEEFFAGAGARNAGRTIFAVGDEKQSIYSFQGADPAGFLEMRQYFNRQVETAGADFARIELTHSFRSTREVLGAVDEVFSAPDAARGLAEPDGKAARHGVTRDSDGGRVELWPPIKADKTADANPWDAPLDRDDDGDARVVLARRIAARIKAMIGCGEVLPSTGQPASEGDFLILLRKRANLAHPLVKALKDAGLKVAGADRLQLTSHIAVQDLMALGTVCWLPADDLSLAALLKSPLFGLNEDDLYTLAADRDGSLHAALAAADTPHLVAAHNTLKRWRRLGRRLRPFDFYATILGADGGRDRLRARLGAEALDPIDEFLAMALDYERDGPASLPGFITWLSAGNTEIKRDMDEHGGEIRVMTVHGSKGLEAPVVFLPDTTSSPTAGNLDSVLFAPGSDVFAPPKAAAWVPRAADCPATISAWRERALRAAEEEYRRLLYVALTRAKDQLYICGTASGKTATGTTWHQMAEAGLAAIGVAVECGDETIWQLGQPGPEAPEAMTTVESDDLPPWLFTKPASASAPQRSTASVPFVGDDDSRQRGTLIHALLEMLPSMAPQRRNAAASQYLGALWPTANAEQRADLLKKATTIIENDAFAILFGPESEAEAPLAGFIGAGAARRFVSGRIDRLVPLDDGSILIVDYKSDIMPPPLGTTPNHYLEQLLVYKRILTQSTPDTLVRTAILWTAVPRLDMVDVGEAP